jgi:hypothetical protein
MSIGQIVTTIVVPAITAVTGFLVFVLDGQVKAVDNKLKIRQEERLDLAGQRDSAQQVSEVRFRIYDAVTKSLETPDPRRQDVAIALVRGMLSIDDPLRAGLLAVFRSSGTSQVKDQAGELLQETRRFTEQQQVIPTETTPTTSTDWRSYNIDLFWCSLPAQAIASGVKQRLLDREARGRLRIRELPPSINASPGYNVAGLVIRREPQEADVAESIKAVADSAVSAKGGFLLAGSRQRTPGYISLFVC